MRMLLVTSIIILALMIAYFIISMLCMLDDQEDINISSGITHYDFKYYNIVRVHILTFIKIYHATYKAPSVVQKHIGMRLYLNGEGKKNVVIIPFIYEAPFYYIWSTYIQKRETVRHDRGLNKLVEILDDVKRGRDEELLRAVKNNEAVMKRLIEDEYKKKDITELKL